MPDANAITAAQLARLSGLTDRRLRELASEGWFPKAVEGRYQLVPTIQGLLRYYREREQSRIMQDAYDSIGACAAATGIPVSTLKHAKRQGSSAFRGSVDFEVGVKFRVNGRRGRNWKVVIAYEPDDTYTVWLVEGHKQREASSMVLACHRDVYCDTLQSVIEATYDEVIWQPLHQDDCTT